MMKNTESRLDVINHETIFFDDFTSDELDRSIWNVEITGNTVNDEQQAYIDSPETVHLLSGDGNLAHGVLVIHPRYRPGFLSPQGKQFDFISGRINTRGKMEFIHGNISARILLPAGTGIWPAFWVMGSSGVWPQCGELDIMENVGEPDWTSTALHGPGYSGETPFVNKKYFQAVHGARVWHVYSLEWTSTDSLSYKVDGELIYRVTKTMVEHYGSWVYDGNKYLILNCALGGTYPHKTNGVHLPYYGIPEATVQSIKNDETRMMIDWVKITKE